MAINVDSSQWTGQHDDTPLKVPVVWGQFPDQEAKERAVAWLLEHGAAASGSTPATRAGGLASPKEAVNEAQVEMPDTHPDEAGRRNVRQGAVGIAMAGTAMAAAGIVIATGGAALPAAAAAAAVGGTAGMVGSAVGQSVDPGTDSGGAASYAPRLEGPLIGVHAPDAETRERAERLLREAGATEVIVQETRAG